MGKVHVAERRVMRAHFNGLIPRNPFAQFHISPNVKEREFLTEDEVEGGNDARVLRSETGIYP